MDNTDSNTSKSDYNNSFININELNNNNNNINTTITDYNIDNKGDITFNNSYNSLDGKEYGKFKYSNSLGIYIPNVYLLNNSENSEYHTYNKHVIPKLESPNNNNIEKSEEKPTILKNFDYNKISYILIYIDNYYTRNHNSNNDYENSYGIKYNFFIAPSILNSNENIFKIFNNFIKIIYSFKVNKIHKNDNISTIKVFESNSKPVFNILFFTTIFMEYHSNGKEYSFYSRIV